MVAAPRPQLDTTAVPEKHLGQTRGSDAWNVAAGLRAAFGSDAALRAWCSGFRAEVHTKLDGLPAWAWGLVLTTVDERAVTGKLLAGAAPAGWLLDRGLLGQTQAEEFRGRGAGVVAGSGRAARRALP